MGIRRFLIDFSVVAAVTLVVTATVTLVWNVLFHGAGRIDWETSFRFAIVFGVVLPWLLARKSS